MFRTFNERTPAVASSAYVDPDATIIGDVTVGPEATVLPGAVIRADGGPVELRARSNVQDNATIHADTRGDGVILHEEAAVGHGAIVHNATVGPHSLVGMDATVLDDVTLAEYVIVAANSLVPEGAEVDANSLVGGTPADVLRDDLAEDHPLFGVGARYTSHTAGFETGEELPPAAVRRPDEDIRFET